jgi:hypothetical protein
MSQHVEAPGMSSAALITRGFDIRRRSQAACGCKKTAMSLDNNVSGSKDKSVHKLIAPEVQLIHKAGVDWSGRRGVWGSSAP